MFHHIVLFKLKDNSEKGITYFRSRFDGFQANLPMLKKITVGTDVSRGEFSFDVALVTEFETREDYQNYLTHPYHLECAKEIKALKSESALVDYED